MSRYILLLIQFVSVVKNIESANSTNGLPAGSGLLLRIDNKIKTLMEVSYKRCLALPNEKLMNITSFPEIVTGENLNKLRKYLIDINNFEPVLKFKDDVLNCDFLTINPESNIKESCNVTETAQILCQNCEKSLTCYNRIMEKMFAKDRIKFTIYYYNSKYHSRISNSGLHFLDTGSEQAGSMFQTN